MSKRTPGPWKIIDDDMDYIAITDEEQNFGICRLEKVANESRVSMVANARLIAAAPELLAELKSALTLLGHIQEATGYVTAVTQFAYRKLIDQVEGEGSGLY